MGEQMPWLLREKTEVSQQMLTAIDFDVSDKFRNINELVAAFVGLIKTKSFTVPADLPLPEGFMRPEVWLPPLDFSPDYFSLAGLTFVSRRFRDALAQPDGVVQYWPIHLARGSEEARAQDYMLFRVLAWQPARIGGAPSASGRSSPTGAPVNIWWRHAASSASCPWTVWCRGPNSSASRRPPPPFW